MHVCMHAHPSDRALFLFYLSSFSLPYIALFPFILRSCSLSLYTAQSPFSFSFQTYSRSSPILCHAQCALCTHALIYFISLSVSFQPFYPFIRGYTFWPVQIDVTPHLTVLYCTWYVYTKAFTIYILKSSLQHSEYIHSAPSSPSSCEHSYASALTSSRACRSHAIFPFWRHLAIRLLHFHVPHSVTVHYITTDKMQQPSYRPIKSF